jgi:mxaA protein
MPMQSRGTFMRECARALCGAGLVLCSAAVLASDASLSVSASEPRAFGYQVGDVVERSVSVFVPAGLVLDESSLPRAGARGKAIELQNVLRRSAAEQGGTRHELTLRYQVFLSPPEVRTLEIAPFVLHFTGQPRDQDVRVEAWPLTVSPLMPVDASPRHGLGELRPDQPPPLIDTRPGRYRLMAYGVVLLLLLGYLAQVYLGLPWWAQRHRPFAKAWRVLGHLPANAPASEWRAAFQRVHGALNQTAGEVLFEHSVDRFVAAQPRYGGLRAELVEFFQRSRCEFFVQATPASHDGRWLLDFCRRCRDAERGAA